MNMNAISQVLEVKVEESQVEEVVLALFHTILLHRASGKFCYRKDDSYHIEELSFEDVKCNSLCLTYIRCSSPALDNSLRCQVARFLEKIRQTGVPTTGQVALEFYEKKKKPSWLFTNDVIPWEVWNVVLKIIEPGPEDYYTKCWSVGEAVSSIIWRIIQEVNRNDYAPAAPTHLELNTVYETGYTDVQPYLFRVNYTVTPVNNPSVTSVMTKLLRDMAIP